MVCFGNKIRLPALFSFFFIFSFSVCMCINCKCVCVYVHACACSVPKIGHQFLIWCSKLISFSFYGHSYNLIGDITPGKMQTIYFQHYWSICLHSLAFSPLCLIVCLNIQISIDYAFICLQSTYLPTYFLSLYNFGAKNTEPSYVNIHHICQHTSQTFVHIKRSHSYTGRPIVHLYHSIHKRKWHASEHDTQTHNTFYYPHMLALFYLRHSPSSQQSLYTYIHSHTITIYSI